PPATPAKTGEAPEVIATTTTTTNKETHLRDTLRDHNYTMERQPARKESLRSKLTYPYGSKHQTSTPIHDHVTTTSPPPASVPTSSNGTSTDEAATNNTPTTENRVRLLDTLRDHRSTNQQ